MVERDMIHCHGQREAKDRTPAQSGGLRGLNEVLSNQQVTCYITLDTHTVRRRSMRLADGNQIEFVMKPRALLVRE